MADELEKFLDELEEPIVVSAKAFLREYRKSRLQIERARIDVPDGLAGAEQATFIFDTNAGSFVFPYAHRLNGALIRLGVAMESPSNEAIRMGKLLIDNLRLPDTRFGKHFTDSVLWPLIDQRFGHIPMIRDALDGLAHHSPYRGESLEECGAYLRAAIDGAGNSIVLQLGYQEPRAFAVLAGAVLYMLDQRHHISLRRTLFPK
jgi:hypothetical protein